MTSTVLWVVGEPGVGKTTLVRELIKRAGPPSLRLRRPKWDVFGGRMAAAGHYDGGKFDGADTIPIGDIKPAAAVWAGNFQGLPLTVFDGDKFSSPWILTWIHAVAPEVLLRCLWLTDEPEVVLARRTERGTVQNPTWVKGRKTKAENFARSFTAGRCLHLQGAKPSDVGKVLKFVDLLW